MDRLLSIYDPQEVAREVSIKHWVYLYECDGTINHYAFYG